MMTTHPPFNRERRLTVFLCALILVSTTLFSACGGRKEASASQEETVDTSDVYVQEVTLDRKRKDLHFLRDEASPLKASDKGSFTGLAYFPVSRSYAFRTALHAETPPVEVTIATSKNRPRTMLRVGWLPFVIEGRELRLWAYAPKDTSDGFYWFVPFTDATTGGESYSAGRFLEIEDVTADSVWLDFNYAYNPYCAYNEAYDCPIPPEENRLPVAIRAGERTHGAGH